MQNVYTVGQVNSYIKNMFSQDFLLQSLFVKGEEVTVNIIPRDIFILR